MKRFTKILSLLLIVSLLFSFVGCAQYSRSDAGGEYYAEMAPSSDAESDGASTEENKNVALPSGMITAGAWNDNDNYQMWVDLFAQGNEQEEKPEGKFYSYVKSQKLWGFDSLSRVKVHVTSDGAPVAGAEVIAYGVDESVLFKAVSDASGNAYLFTNKAYGTVAVSSGEARAEAKFNADDRDISIELDSCAEKLNVIEMMFVVDVTGSMGDELRFLQAELDDVIKKIAANDAQTVIRLALLFYRDHGDDEIFKYCDFVDITDSNGLKSALGVLASQSASGGGDYEEAVDEALEMAVNAQWSTGATTKLIFHVLDAPAHSGSSYEKRFNNAVISAAEKGIRINPILCSGAAEITEYTMRQAAIHTGGTFIFVTDDSGIGGEHHDPGLPNVTVELLNSMLVRLIKGYHTGTFEDPVYWKDDPALALNK